MKKGDLVILHSNIKSKFGAFLIFGIYVFDSIDNDSYFIGLNTGLYKTFEVNRHNVMEWNFTNIKKLAVKMNNPKWRKIIRESLLFKIRRFSSKYK